MQVSYIEKTMRRSNCPVCVALDTFGDKWSLLIIRDILLFGKTTYREFLDSPEAISTNILADRLRRLVREGLIEKSPHASDGRIDVYALTDRGIDLIPMIAEMMLWSVRNKSRIRIPQSLVDALEKDREGALALFREKAERGEALV